MKAILCGFILTISTFSVFAQTQPAGESWRKEAQHAVPPSGNAQQNGAEPAVTPPVKGPQNEGDRSATPPATGQQNGAERSATPPATGQQNGADRSVTPPATGQQDGAERSATPPATGQQNGAERSVLEVKPGEEALKNKDLYEATGYFHPFRRMGRFVLTDQKKIWTSPFHTSKSDIKWWAVFGAATGALIATDKWTEKHAPTNDTLVRIGKDTSYIGAAYTLIPIASGFYFLGTAKGSERFRETGLLCFETLIDTTIVETVIKAATDRARPLEGNGKGGFWDSSGPPWNASFPSGHSINTFALASVFAHEYHDKLWVKILAYGYAGGVVGARLAAKKHFPGDVVAGGAMGWFIGDYVYGKRHNPASDTRPRSIAQKVMDHVHFGFAWN